MRWFVVLFVVGACAVPFGGDVGPTQPFQVTRECKGRTATGSSVGGQKDLAERLAAARAYHAIAVSHLEAGDWDSAEFCANSGASAIALDEPPPLTDDDEELHRLLAVELRSQGATDKAARERLSILESRIATFERRHPEVSGQVPSQW